MTDDVLPVRRVRFEYPPDTRAAWIPNIPEFAYAANGVSLLMPYAEPLFIKAVKRVQSQLSPESQLKVDAYVKQEVGHYTEHKRFNEIIRAQHPRVARVETMMEQTANWVSRRSPEFHLAFTSGGEIMSFLLARWVAKNPGRILGGADPVPATLFLWHLAEEVEHKSSAWAVYEEIDGSKLRYGMAMILGTVLIGIYAWMTALVQLADDGRLWSPVSHFRLFRWSISLAFELFPSMLISMLPGHGPDSFASPLLLETWLRQYDPVTETMPLWEHAGRSAS